MEKKEVIIIAVLAAFVAARLYQKYIKKDKNVYGKKPESQKNELSSSADDDYEPYSKK